MSEPLILPAHRTKTFATAADLLDADGLKTSIATAATIQTYQTSGLNGAYMNPGPKSLGLAFTPTATASSNAGSYVNASTIQFVGTYGGQTVTRTATVVGTDGGATFEADGQLDYLSSIVVAAQVNTGGAWTFGVTDPGAGQDAKGNPRFFRVVQAVGADGNVAVVYDGGFTDTLVLLSGQEKVCFVKKLDSSACTTGVCVSWLWPTEPQKRTKSR